MSEEFDFVKIEAYDGIHYIRRNLIMSISQYENTMFVGLEQHTVDVKTKLYYNNGDAYYFTEEIETVIEKLKGGW